MRKLTNDTKPAIQAAFKAYVPVAKIVCGECAFRKCNKERNREELLLMEIAAVVRKKVNVIPIWLLPSIFQRIRGRNTTL